MTNQPYEGATPEQLRHPVVREFLRVHDYFRNQLAKMLGYVDDLIAGEAQLNGAETVTRTQDLIRVGRQYTRYLHTHHHGETSALFPALQAEGLEESIVNRLNAEHDEIAVLIDRFNAAIQDLAAVDPDAMDTDLRRLAEALHAHLAYEETHVCPLLTRFSRWPIPNQMNRQEFPMTLTPRFGIFLDPTAGDPREPFRWAQVADENGLDLLTIQDHPYQWRYYETWTLLTALAMATEHIHVSTNVANLPLRLPAVLAKQAATLDVLTGGRVELGLGAGGFWDAIKAFGGPKRPPGDAYAAFEDALHILRGMWDSTGKAFTYQGQVYTVKGAKPGPAPAHRIPIWTGAAGPRMLRLTGRMADGIFLSMPYVPLENLPRFNALIDEGASEAGRSPESIRRGYNISGVIRPGAGSVSYPGQQGGIGGTAGYWVDQISRLYHEYRQDTFIFWGGGDVAQQIEVFAREVVPAVKERVAASIPMTNAVSTPKQA